MGIIREILNAAVAGAVLKGVEHIMEKSAEAGISIPNWSEKRNRPYGVFAINNVNGEFYNDIVNNGEDLGWKEAKKEFLADLRDKLSGVFEEIAHGSLTNRIIDDIITGVVENNIGDLMGDRDESGPFEYTDGDIHYLTGELGGATLVWVVDSPWVVSCRECSPCVPGAGDLDESCKSGIEVLAPDSSLVQDLANTHGKTYYMRNLETNEERIIHPIGQDDDKVETSTKTAEPKVIPWTGLPWAQNVAELESFLTSAKGLAPHELRNEINKRGFLPFRSSDWKGPALSSGDPSDFDYIVAGKVGDTLVPIVTLVYNGLGYDIYRQY